jgi:predicted NBD/HSP70 family sugar kinase
MATQLGSTGSELLRLAQGDDRARSVIYEGGKALGIALAAVINLLNPHLLVLGGGTLSLPGYGATALEFAQQYSLPGSYSACTLRLARAGKAVAALGAARAVMSKT